MRKLCKLFGISILALMFAFLPVTHGLAANRNQEVFVDTDILYFDVSGLDLQDTSTARGTTEDILESSSATYSYSMEIDRENPEIAYVTLIFKWNIGEQTLSAALDGTIDAYHLSDGSTLWEGVLRGSAPWNGAESNILCGFSRIDQNDKIQANISVSTADGASIMFSIGDIVTTLAIYDELNSRNSEDLPAAIAESSTN